jgi:hypothetical protein
MSDTSSRVAWGAVGLIVGFLMGSGLFRWPAHMFMAPSGELGTPFVWLLNFVPLLFFPLLWILLIAGAIRWLFNPRDRSRGRLADLPADFDDWHRRAHAQMAREAASADDSGRRG